MPESANLRPAGIVVPYRSRNIEHYHRERNHRGLDNRLIQLPAVETADHYPIRCHSRLSGMLNFYYRETA